jgi:hypothetical protein
MKQLLLFWVFGILFVTQLCFSQQDISGTWQGTIQAGPQELRIVLKIAKDNNGGWTGVGYSLDQTNQPIPLTSVTFQDSNFKIVADSVQATYEGKLNADGLLIEGILTQGGTLPLNLHRANKETEWKIDGSTPEPSPADKTP